MHSDLGAWRIGSVHGPDPSWAFLFSNICQSGRTIVPSHRLPCLHRLTTHFSDFTKWSHRVKGGSVYGRDEGETWSLLRANFLGAFGGKNRCLLLFACCPWALEVPDIIICYCLCCLLQPQYPLVSTLCLLNNIFSLGSSIESGVQFIISQLPINATCRATPPRGSGGGGPLTWKYVNDVRFSIRVQGLPQISMAYRLNLSLMS